MQIALIRQSKRFCVKDFPANFVFQFWWHPCLDRLPYYIAYFKQYQGWPQQYEYGVIFGLLSGKGSHLVLYKQKEDQLHWIAIKIMVYVSGTVNLFSFSFCFWINTIRLKLSLRNILRWICTCGQGCLPDLPEDLLNKVEGRTSHMFSLCRYTWHSFCFCPWRCKYKCQQRLEYFLELQTY